MLLAVVSTIAAIVGAIVKTAADFVRDLYRSKHAQWKDLSVQFHRIAQADIPARPIEGRQKTYATLHFGRVAFGGGLNPSHAPVCDALSRTAGRLFKRSVAGASVRRSGDDVRGLWIKFVAQNLANVDRKTAVENIHVGQAGESDQYLHVDVFPYAAYLACERCASEERP